MLVRNGVLKPSNWPAESGELSHKTNLHCSLPATVNNNIIGGKWDGITHCSALSGSMPDKSNHCWITLTMTGHFRRCLDLFEGGRIMRTHLDGNYVFDPISNRLLDEVTVLPHLADEDPAAAEAEELERAEEAACYSAGSGAAKATPVTQDSAASEPPPPTQATTTQSEPELISVPDATPPHSVSSAASRPSTPSAISSPSIVATVMRAPLSSTNTIVKATVKFSDVVRSAFAKRSPFDEHWFDRPEADRERVTREWSAGMGKGSTEEADSARSGAAVPMEVEIPEYTQEDLQQARGLGLHVRHSLSVAYEKILDLIGPAGLAFKRPTSAGTAAAPAAAAVPAEEPPLQTC